MTRRTARVAVVTLALDAPATLAQHADWCSPSGGEMTKQPSSRTKGV